MKKNLTEPEIARLVVGRLGGPHAVARLCHIKPPAIYDWFRVGLPAGRIKYLVLERPDVFVGTPYEIKEEETG